MRVTKAQLQTTLNALKLAGDQGVHASKISLLTLNKQPDTIIKKLKEQGYVFKTITHVEAVGKFGIVYILLERNPRKYFTYEFEGNVAKPVELNKQQELFI